MDVKVGKLKEALRQGMVWFECLASILVSGFVWGFVFFLGVGGVRKWLDILRIALIERKSEHLLGY